MATRRSVFAVPVAEFAAALLGQLEVRPRAQVTGRAGRATAAGHGSCRLYHRGSGQSCLGTQSDCERSHSR